MQSFVEITASVAERQTIAQRMRDFLGHPTDVIDTVDPSANGQQHGQLMVIVPGAGELETVEKVGKAIRHAVGDDEALRRSITGPAFLYAT